MHIVCACNRTAVGSRRRGGLRKFATSVATTSTGVQVAVVTLVALLALHCAAASPAEPRPPTHRLSKRSFFDIQCKGVYDKQIYARVDRICEDCYNLFRETQLHSLCRKDCFANDFFKACMESLQLIDETNQIKIWIKQLHGADATFGV